MPLLFSPRTTLMTRAVGAEAATALGGTIYVYATKNEANSNAGQMVMDNYSLHYAAGTAHTTSSNSAGWEYVGFGNFGGSISQTIKYWDYGADNYTFYAFAAKDGDITSLTNTIGQADRHNNGYQLTLGDGADWSKLYFAKRSELLTANYGGQVILSFMSALAKVRIGIYETIPGYSLHVDKMYGAETDESTTQSMLACANIAAEGAHDITVNYDNYNTPQLAVSATAEQQRATLTLGTHIMAAEAVGETTTLATMEDYISVLPQTNCETNMQLTMDFTITTTDKTKEQIRLQHATAVVPYAYVRWRAGYAYTYLFKVSDNTNGQHGSLTGLYPITFYGVVITDPEGVETTWLYDIEDEKFGLGGDIPDGTL